MQDNETLKDLFNILQNCYTILKGNMVLKLFTTLPNLNNNK